MISDGNSGIPATMLVGPTGYNAPVYSNGCGTGFGGDGWWIILLLLACGGGWGGMGGFGGGWGNMMGMGIDFPWLMNGQQNIMSNDNGNYRDAMLNDGITGIRGSLGDIQTQLCGGFAGVTASVTNAQNALAQQMYTNQISDLERSFNAQTASMQGMNAIQSQLATCCCENRAATQDLKYTLATEACATRAANTQNTQAILDKLCQLELDGYKRENDQLRSQLQFANMQASQVAQTAELRTSQATVANQLVSELRSCPIPSQPVYGNQPIFTCGSTASGCGCGNSFAN